MLEETLRKFLRQKHSSIPKNVHRIELPRSQSRATILLIFRMRLFSTTGTDTEK